MTNQLSENFDNQQKHNEIDRSKDECQHISDDEHQSQFSGDSNAPVNTHVTNKPTDEELESFKEYKKSFPVANLLKLQLKRSDLHRFCHSTLFDDLVIGSFVRYGIGLNGNDERVYRVCEVVRVEKSSRRYNFDGTLIEKKLVLRIGKSERAFHLNQVSNQPFSKAECYDWLLRMVRCRESLPNPDAFKKRAKYIGDTLRNQLSGMEFHHIFMERCLYDLKPANLTQAQNEINRQLKIARHLKQKDRADLLEARYDELERIIDEEYSFLDRIERRAKESYSRRMQRKNTYLTKKFPADACIAPPVFRRKYWNDPEAAEIEKKMAEQEKKAKEEEEEKKRIEEEMSRLTPRERLKYPYRNVKIEIDFSLLPDMEECSKILKKEPPMDPEAVFRDVQERTAELKRKRIEEIVKTSKRFRLLNEGEPKYLGEYP